MFRDEALALVAAVETKHNQYRAVTHADALALLGEARFGKLLGDKIRGCGPAPGLVYPWNVVDYLIMPVSVPEPVVDQL